MIGARDQTVILPTPIQLNKNTDDVTHQDGNGVAGQEDIVVKYQIPVGMALVIGGAKDKQKFFYFQANTSVPAVIAGTVTIYKVTPYAKFQRIQLGEWHTSRTAANASNQNELVDIGKEVAKTIKAFERLFIAFTPDTAATYDEGESIFRLDVTALMAVNPVN